MKRAYCIAAFIVLLTAVSAPAQEKVSRPGQYSGYSKKIFDGWARSSQYVTVRDATKIAVDIYRPALHGQVSTERYSVVFVRTQYRRAITDGNGNVICRFHSVAASSDSAKLYIWKATGKP